MFKDLDIQSDMIVKSLMESGFSFKKDILSMSMSPFGFSLFSPKKRGETIAGSFSSPHFKFALKASLTVTRRFSFNARFIIGDPDPSVFLFSISLPQPACPFKTYVFPSSIYKEHFSGATIFFTRIRMQKWTRITWAVRRVSSPRCLKSRPPVGHAVISAAFNRCRAGMLPSVPGA